MKKEILVELTVAEKNKVAEIEALHRDLKPWEVSFMADMPRVASKRKHDREEGQAIAYERSMRRQIREQWGKTNPGIGYEIDCGINH